MRYIIDLSWTLMNDTSSYFIIPMCNWSYSFTYHVIVPSCFFQSIKIMFLMSSDICKKYREHSILPQLSYCITELLRQSCSCKSASPPFCLGWGGRGVGGAGEPPTKFNKGDGLDRISIFRGGDFFLGGCSFYIKSKLKSEIFHKHLRI